MTYYTPDKEFEARSLAKGSDVLQELNAVAAAFNLAAVDLTELQGEVAVLQAGSPINFGASLDIRYALTSVSGTNTITATAATAPAGTDNLAEGHYYWLQPANDNTGNVTLDIGTADGAVSIKQLSSGSYAELASGDLQSGGWYLIIYDASESAWLLMGTSGSAVQGYFTTQFFDVQNY